MHSAHMPQIENRWLNLSLPTSYVHQQVGKTGPLLILLHGWTDSGPSFFRRVASALPTEMEILAPNGFFPVPQKIEGKWRDAYSWYFMDVETKRTLIPPEVSARGLKTLLEELGLADRPKILCGFSQGGYFLPRLALQLSHVKSFVVIGGGYPKEEYQKLSAVPVIGIHGADDDVVPLQEAQKDFDRLDEPFKRRFHIIPGMDHDINADGRAELKAVLRGLL